jgi:hypothetical protein
MNKKHPYGYKVGYRESGSRLFIKHFMTYNYNQALSARHFYRKYPQRTRETNRPIIDPFWEIKPITKKEYLAGIWNEPPFLYKKTTPFKMQPIFYPILIKMCTSYSKLCHPFSFIGGLMVA